MSYDEQPAWVWRDGKPYIRLPARAVDTEWRVLHRSGVYGRCYWIRVHARVPARAPHEVIMTWCRGMEWCAQERPAPERRSGKDRRKPSAPQSEVCWPYTTGTKATIVPTVTWEAL